jgi:cysteine-rich repeat protein
MSLALVVLVVAGWSRLASAVDAQSSGPDLAPGTVGAGPVLAMVVDPHAPTTLYAGTWCSGVLKTTDAGVTWAATGLTGAYVGTLAIDPKTPTTLYATIIYYGGVFQTTNSGGSWNLTSPGGLSVHALAIDPSTPSTLYAGTSGGSVFQSTNSGGSWSETGLNYGFYVYALAIDPSTPSTLYAGTSAGVFQSTNSGGRWSAVNTGLTDTNGSARYVLALAIDPTTPSTLYAGTQWGGVFKSTNSGGSWSAVNTGLTHPGVYALAIDPTTPTTLYVGIFGGGVFKSTDAATTWHATGLVEGPLCGDGILTCGEACDDGNLINGDGCDANCTLTACGNGIVTAGEECDDGNRVNGDDCENDCTLPRCGNGIVDAGEACDDGNRVDGDGCENDCTLPRCGNGIVDAGEECDDGNLINGDGCDANCTLPRCGNGILDAGEECDDGNRNPFDGCTNACTSCGNGIATPPEECDDGNTNPSDGCTNACTACGDGIVTPPEECDDGNRINGDGCDVNCTLLPRCGNGIVDAGDECDDGGICIGSTNAGDFCSAAGDCPGGYCTTFGGDGCAANCTTESEVTFNLVPGVQQGLTIAPGTSGTVLNAEILTIPLPLSGRQTLTIGKERNGQIPVVIKAAAVHLARLPVSTIGCLCPRAVAVKTCGGTVFEPDGVTPSLDCTPGFTAGDSVCQGKNPCALVHGPGNSAAGAIGCDGLDGVNVSLTQDSGGSSGIPKPPQLTVSGTGGSGSAVLFATTAMGGEICNCGMFGCDPNCAERCTGQNPAVYGADGELCTDDDPQDQRGTPVTVPVTTGTATAQLLNANQTDGDTLGPFSVTGAPFSCSGLEASGSGAALASTFTELSNPTIGDGVFTSVSVLVACAGDCDGSRDVAINEVITLVNIALGTAPLSACTAGDADHSGTIEINDIIQAVNNALNGCPVPPTPAVPTSTVTPASTPTQTPTQTPTVTPTPCFTDNGDGTISDCHTQLLWEKKTGTVGGSPGDTDPQNVNNRYTWSAGGTAADGTAFTDFLPRLNATGLGGHRDWRLPTIAELQTILLAPFPCSENPCIDPVFGPTQSFYYWSATSDVPLPTYAWFVYFYNGGVYYDFKSFNYYVRAVRVGL